MISEQEIHNSLLFEFPYYKKINEEKRNLLCRRTKYFIDGTHFIPKKGLVLTNRMKILIAACSQQLTLGFKKHYGYAYFDKVIVYPEKYLSTYTEKYHTGEMNTAGIIVLSWEDFYKGIKIDNDARNVGLHEFAHALEFMDIANKDIDETFSACLDKFTVFADYYLQNKSDKPLFRSYATTNLSEFFAVATEYYFESPNEFALQEPELFAILKRAYKQNTAPKVSKIKQQILPKPVSNDLFFENYSGSKYGFIEVFAYIFLTICSCAFISVSRPIIAILILLCGGYLIYSRVFKNYFSLYKNQVQIHKPFMKRLVDSVFRKGKIHDDIYIDYSNVLYVSGDEYYSDQLDSNFDRQKTGVNYTLCYWNKGRIHYAKLSTTNTNYDFILLFLYKKKVGTRINGAFKKYRFA